MNKVLTGLTALLHNVQQQEIAAHPTNAGDVGFLQASGEKSGTLAQQAEPTRTQHQAENKRAKPEEEDAMQAMLGLLLTRPALSPPAEMRQTGAPPQNSILARLAASPADRGPQQVLLLKTLSAQQRDPRAPLLVVRNPAVTEKSVEFTPVDLSGSVSLTPPQQARLIRATLQDPQLIGQVHNSQHEEHVRPTNAQPPLTRRHVMVQKTHDQHALTTPAGAPLRTAALMSAENTSQTVKETHSAMPVSLSSEAWGEKLTGLLKERIHFQITEQKQISTIRLDPPSLGKLEIAIQFEAGKLVVHISASQPEVCRSLQQLSEQLRLQLASEQFTQVQVQIFSDSGKQQHQQGQSESQEQKDEILDASIITVASDKAKRRDPLLIKV